MLKRGLEDPTVQSATSAIGIEVSVDLGVGVSISICVMYVCNYACMYACMYVGMYVYIYILYTRTCKNTDTQTCKHMCIFKKTYRAILRSR